MLSTPQWFRRTMPPLPPQPAAPQPSRASLYSWSFLQLFERFHQPVQLLPGLIQWHDFLDGLGKGVAYLLLEVLPAGNAVDVGLNFPVHPLHLGVMVQG